MNGNLSLPEMLADLERRVAFHREQEGAHAQHETFHRDERARHAAALELAMQQLAALRTAASDAAAFLREASPVPAAEALPEPAADGPRLLSKRVALVVQEWPAGVSFGASAVAAEVARRFAGAPGRSVAVSTVAKTLLRLCEAGVLRSVRAGAPYRESLFQRDGSRPS